MNRSAGEEDRNRKWSVDCKVLSEKDWMAEHKKDAYSRQNIQKEERCILLWAAGATNWAKNRFVDSCLFLGIIRSMRNEKVECSFDNLKITPINHAAPRTISFKHRFASVPNKQLWTSLAVPCSWSTQKKKMNKTKLCRQTAIDYSQKKNLS